MPKYWPLQHPGDLVEIDTKEIRMRRGVLLKHFSARDVVSRWDVVATSCAIGNIPTTACALASPSPTSPHWNSSLVGKTIGERQSVANLLDEYIVLQPN
jgi:hypothetical protein